MSLFDTVKADYVKLKGEIPADVEDMFRKHLGFANIAAHLAQDAASISQSPFFAQAETFAGLPGKVQADIAEFAGKASGWVEHEVQAAEQPATA